MSWGSVDLCINAHTNNARQTNVHQIKWMFQIKHIASYALNIEYVSTDQIWKN